MIVVDLGCAPHGDERSIEPLIERFHPDVLYGFDPNEKGLAEAEEALVPLFSPTKIILDAKAAWIYDGFIGYQEDGLRSRVNEASFREVPCFDLSRWLLNTAVAYPTTITKKWPWSTPTGPLPKVVVKMDVEGAEKPLLEHLLHAGTDEAIISLLLVEWHDHRDFVKPYDRADLIARLRCPVEEWG